MEMDQETKWLIERTRQLIEGSKKEIGVFRASIVEAELEIKRLKAVIEEAQKEFKKRK
jgi:hypothetical protein